MTQRIKVALIGVGNCTSSIVQGLSHYRGITAASDPTPGLMHNVIGPYTIDDIEIVAAFDVNANKIGQDLAKAIFSKPNNATRFSDVAKTDVNVSPGFIGDGIARELLGKFPLTERPDSVVRTLRESGAHIAVNAIPTGSRLATDFYAQACIDAGVAFINGIPEFVASTPEWIAKFEAAGLPCAGDDVMSQVGATITNRVLLELALMRGQTVTSVVQNNYGNNADFQNLVCRDRITSKSISKAAPLIFSGRSNSVVAGPGDYDKELRDDEKVAKITVIGEQFGGVEYRIDAKLSVEDSPNFAGVMVDAIRCMRLSLDRGLTGYQDWSCFFFKSPYRQVPLFEGRHLVEKFIAGQ